MKALMMTQFLSFFSIYSTYLKNGREKKISAIIQLNRFKSTLMAEKINGMQQFRFNSSQIKLKSVKDETNELLLFLARCFSKYNLLQSVSNLLRMQQLPNNKLLDHITKRLIILTSTTTCALISNSTFKEICFRVRIRKPV